MIKAVLACLLLAPAQIAAAQEAKPCLDRAEAGDLVTAMLPSIVDGVSRKCSASLPAGAFLRTGSGALVQRLRAEAARRSAGSTRAIVKVLGSDIPSGVSGDTLARFFEEGFAGEMLNDLKAEDCGAADRLLAALAPLPQANFGAFVAAFLELGGKGDETAPFALCETRR